MKGWHSSPPRRTWYWTLLVVVSLAYLGLIALRAPYINGSWHWKWTWRDQPLTQIWLYLSLPALLLALAVSRQSDAAHPWPALLAIVVATTLFQYGVMLAQPGGFRTVQTLVEHRYTGSYFVAAQEVSDQEGWLAEFHNATRPLHAATHPPGPVLYFTWFLRLFPQSRAALTAGAFQGLLAASGCVAMYMFVSLWTDSRLTKLLAAAIHGSTPGLISFFPGFDAFYAGLAMLLIFSWERALRRRLVWGAPMVASGILLTFMAYNMLLLGVYFVGSGAWFLWQTRGDRRARRRVAMLVTIGLGALVGFYAALYLATGFQPIATFESSLAALARIDKRPSAPALIFNLYDFFLGAGTPVMVLATLWGFEMLRAHRLATYPNCLLPIGWLTVLIINASSLLDWETARVWLFLQPFVTVPAALELTDWPLWQRVGVVVLQAVTTATLNSAMVFSLP